MTKVLINIPELKNADEFIQLSNKYVIVRNRINEIEIHEVVFDDIKIDGIPSTVSTIRDVGYMKSKLVAGKIYIAMKQSIHVLDDPNDLGQDLIFNEYDLECPGDGVIIDIEYDDVKAQNIILTNNSIIFLNLGINEPCSYFELDMKLNLNDENKLIKCHDSYFGLGGKITNIIYKDHDDYEHATYSEQILSVAYTGSIYIGINNYHELRCLSMGYENKAYEINELRHRWFGILNIEPKRMVIFGSYASKICIATSPSSYGFKITDWNINYFEYHDIDTKYFAEGNLCYTSNGFCALIDVNSIKIFDRKANNCNNIIRRFYNENIGRHAILDKDVGLTIYDESP